MRTTSPIIPKSSRLVLRVAGVAAALLALHQAALAADTTTTSWSGGNSTWGTNTNWAGSVLPSTSVSAKFDSTFTNQPTLGAAQTAQGIWLAPSVGQNVTIDSGSAQTLTITGTATLNAQTNAGIYMNDSGNHTLTIGPNTSILLSNTTGFYNQETTGILTISGGLDLNIKTLTIGDGTSAGSVTIGGNITSTTGGVLTINSAGTVTLNGNNSYKGTTTLTAGTLVAGSSTAFGTGALALSGGTFQASTDVVFTNTISLGAGTTTFSGANSITISGNSTTGTGFIGGSPGKTLTNNLASGKTLTFSGNLQLNSSGTSRQLTIGGTGNTAFSGILSESSAANGTFAVTSTGITTFSGNNTFSGPVTVSSGATLKAGNANALGFGGTAKGGNTLGTTTVSSGGVLDLNGNTGISEPITISGTGISSAGSLINSSGSLASISTGIAGLTVPAAGSGSGYSSAPTITIGGTGSNAAATATLGLTTASISSITGGGTSGWAVNDTLTVAGTGGGLGAVATVTSVNGSNQVTGLSITTAGVDFSTSTTGLTLARATGSGVGTVTVSFNTTNFTVGGIKMTAAGSGYTGTPTATWSGGGSATAVLSSVTLAANSSIGGSGDVTIDAVVGESGSRTLTKVGAGTLTLSAVNTYTGATTIRAGKLVAGTDSPVSTNGAFGNASSALVLGDGSTLATDAPSLLINGAYTVARAISVGSVANTAAYNATIGGSNTSGTSTFTGNITLATTAANYTATLQAATGGTVEFKTGTWATNNKAIAIGSSGNTGSVIISNALATTGGISVNFGTLSLNSAFTGGNMTVASGATLGGNGSVAGTTGVTGGTVNGSGLTLTGVTTFNSAGNTLSGTVTSTSGVSLASSAALTLNGALTGTLAVGNGTLTGSGGSVSGATTLNGGTITLTSGTLGGTLAVTGGNWNGAGSVTGTVTSSSGTFSIGSGANLTANGGLNVTSGTILAGNSSSTITGNVNYTSNSNSTYAGVIAGNTKTLTLNNASAVLALSGTNTYSGDTTVTAGTLLVNGSTSSSSAVTVTGGSAASAVLGGAGNIGGSIAFTTNSGGILAPGDLNAIGTLTAGAVTASLASGITMDLGATASSYDILQTTGLTATNFTLTVTSTRGLTFANGQSFNLFQAHGGGTQAVAGIFSDVKLPTLSGGLQWDESKLYSLGQLNVVPEPSTWALLAFSLTTVMVFRRRRS